MGLFTENGLLSTTMFTQGGLFRDGLIDSAAPDLSSLMSNGVLPNFLSDFRQDIYVVDGVRKTFSDIWTFSRASSATRFNPLGLLEVVAADVPRIEFDPTTLQRIGIVTESSVTNNLLYSQDFANAAWVKTNLTAAMNAIGVDGVANSAATLTATGASASIIQSLVLAAAQRTFSIWMKRKTGTGTILLTRNNGAATTDVTSLISSGSWTRVTVLDTYVVNPQVGVIISTLGDEVIVFGAQDENSRGVTSYIPTTSSAVSRAADNLSNLASNVVPFLGWWTDTDDTLLMDANTPSIGGSVCDYLSINPFTDAIAFGVNNNNFQFYVNMGTRNSRTRAAFSTLSKNVTGAAKDNVQYVRTASRTVARDSINLGSIRCIHTRLVHWPQNVNNSELQRLTTL